MAGLKFALAGLFVLGGTGLPASADHHMESSADAGKSSPLKSIAGSVMIVSDIDATAGFLTDELGMSLVRTADTERYRETILTAGPEGGASLVLIQMLEGESSVGPARVIFNTSDAPAVSAALKAAGYTVTVDRPTFVLANDADGNSFEFIQR
ncbi:MAG: hypothetical protein CMK07_04570 [Ponticaulis sp.]|nr:hypothetical protein [Ponticaulis sp.]